MFKILALLLTLSCFENKLKKLGTLFKRGNTSVDNRIIYNVERDIEINNMYKFKVNLIYTKDLNKDKLIIKDENGKTVEILKNQKLILKNSNIVLPSSNNTIELIYNIFLYSSLELNKVLKILNILEYESIDLSPNLVKITFKKEGYIIYDRSDNTVKELNNIMYDNNIKFENKMYFSYKILNKMLLLDKFRLESKEGSNVLIVEEKINR